jgi:hypothetical protein
VVGFLLSVEEEGCGGRAVSESVDFVLEDCFSLMEGKGLQGYAPKRGTLLGGVDGCEQHVGWPDAEVLMSSRALLVFSFGGSRAGQCWRREASRNACTVRNRGSCNSWTTLMHIAEG